MLDETATAAPLGPDALTWKYFGETSAFLLAPWAGAMQNMHPKLGAAVEQHSVFSGERWNRLMRSVYPIAGVVFDGARAPKTAAEVRDYHAAIKGVDAQGRRYHALDPDVFYWAHATFFMTTILTAEHFMGGITDAQKRQLFDEHVQWYRLYGLSMRPVPATWEAFQIYWDAMCRDVLEDNKATRQVLETSTLEKPPFLPLPDRAWELLRPVVVGPYMWISIGFLPETIRDRLGYRWTRRDAWGHRRIAQAITLASRIVPARLRKHPRARAGLDRAHGRISASAPLVEAERRYMPPAAHWREPQHYNPYRSEEP